MSDIARRLEVYWRSVVSDQTTGPDVMEVNRLQRDRIRELEAENKQLREFAQTVATCGLEPIDDAYRRLAREALKESKDE